jgi:hypothetical protein
MGGKQWISLVFWCSVNFSRQTSSPNHWHFSQIGRDMLNADWYNLNEMRTKSGSFEFELNLPKMPRSFEKRYLHLPLSVRSTPDNPAPIGTKTERQTGWARRCGF